MEQEGVWATRRKIAKLHMDLNTSQRAPPTQRNLDAIKIISSQLEEALKIEEVFWFQRAKNKWIQQGDHNTRFFHMSTLNRRRQNYISAIQNSEGDWMDKQKDIKRAFISYFQNIYSFGSPLPCPDWLHFPSKISDTENKAICDVPSDEEIEDVIKSMNPYKAPRPDGFPALFF